MTLSEVYKKHLKIIAYLVVSAVLAYILSLIANKPEVIYLTPVINYVLYVIKTEVLDKEGIIQALRDKK
jgi:hypothetical protein